jgi:hypothetical protein
MKNSFFWVVLVAVLAIVVAAIYFTSRNISGSNDAMNAAYQDGRYLGKLAAKSGQPPHVAFARWSTDSDRDAFIRGYETTYEQTVSVLKLSNDSEAIDFHGRR